MHRHVLLCVALLCHLSAARGAWYADAEPATWYRGTQQSYQGYPGSAAPRALRSDAAVQQTQYQQLQQQQQQQQRGSYAALSSGAILSVQPAPFIEALQRPQMTESAEGNVPQWRPMSENVQGNVPQFRQPSQRGDSRNELQRRTDTQTSGQQVQGNLQQTQRTVQQQSQRIVPQSQAPQTQRIFPQTQRTVPPTQRPVPQTQRPVPQTQRPVPQTQRPVPQTQRPVPQTQRIDSDNELASKDEIPFDDYWLEDDLKDQQEMELEAATTTTNNNKINNNNNNAIGDQKNNGGPSRCVWAIVTCCKPRLADKPDIRYACFEAVGCHGAFWDAHPCSRNMMQAALQATTNFYNNPPK